MADKTVNNEFLQFAGEQSEVLEYYLEDESSV